MKGGGVPLGLVLKHGIDFTIHIIELQPHYFVCHQYVISLRLCHEVIGSLLTQLIKLIVGSLSAHCVHYH